MEQFYSEIIPGDPLTENELLEVGSPLNHNRKAPLSQHIINLREQWIGYPYALYDLSVQIASIRRHQSNLNPDIRGVNHPDIKEHVSKFYWLLENHTDLIVENIYHEHLHLRWVMSVLDTIIDTHNDPLMRMQALCLMSFGKCLPKFVNLQWSRDFYRDDTFANMLKRTKKNLEETWDESKDPRFVMLRFLKLIEFNIQDQATYDIPALEDSTGFIPLEEYLHSGPIGS